MKLTYGMTEETCTLGDSSRTSYGITAYADSDQDGTATIVSSVHDVTADKQKLFLLIAECNRSELSAIHLQDIIEDFLAQ